MCITQDMLCGVSEAIGGVLGEGGHNVFSVPQRLRSRKGALCQKCELVDTTFHASCMQRPCTATESALPTMWERGNQGARAPSNSVIRVYIQCSSGMLASGSGGNIGLCRLITGCKLASTLCALAPGVLQTSGSAF